MSASSIDLLTRRSTERAVLVETEKLIIIQDEHGMYGEPAPSKVAPQYLQELIDTPYLDEDVNESFDSSCSRTFEELQDFRKRIQEEERLSRMYKLKQTFSLRFDNRAWLHPHGTTNFDYKAISEQKKDKAEKFKNRVREDNYKYLGFHPEIQAIISLGLKKVLSVLPSDPVRFLTEYFTTRMGNRKEFEDSVVAEGRKISKYHVNKMKAAGRIAVRSCTAVRSEISGESWQPEQDANYLKKMNIGALAQDFAFDASSLKSKKKKSGLVEKLKLKKKPKKKCGPTNYCGCKDWKLKKNRESNTPVALTDPEEAEEVQTTTFSTLGNINDNLLTSAEEDDDEDEEEEEEDEQVEFGDGIFLGEMEERADELGNLTTQEAEMIAGLLVQEFLGGGTGAQAGNSAN